jgi:hypothetical protein
MLKFKLRKSRFNMRKVYAGSFVAMQHASPLKQDGGLTFQQLL